MLTTDKVDVLEDEIKMYSRAVLDILLKDKTTGKNILWATEDYQDLGIGFGAKEEIHVDLITGSYGSVIQPRITKAEGQQYNRTREKAEVFTPAWICNEQNNLIDTAWFGRTDVFNHPDGHKWDTTPDVIQFPKEASKSWQKYVDAQRLEITCGEAPYLVSRYDTVTGAKIPLSQRIGILDRKMRVVKENTETAEDWLTWAQRAFESVYGYEYQGDNLLLARENLLYSYIEYYRERFHQMPSTQLLRKIAGIISWNIWQMDGLKYVVPGSCKPEEIKQMSLSDYLDGEDADMDDGANQCPGCAKGDIYRHTGIYCRVMDWRSKRSGTFLSMMKGGKP